MSDADALVGRMLARIRESHPRSARGVDEAIAVDPARFHQIAGRMLTWLEQAHGEGAVERAVDAFVGFSNDVNLHQARYEQAGRYEHSSFEEMYQSHYATSAMRDYLFGVYLTNFLWAHHMEISAFFEDRFLRRLRHGIRVVEIAPGHGGWGVTALHSLPGATLRAFDISPSSLEIARPIAAAAGLGERAVYEERNALDLDSMPAGSAQAVICSFLVEHLEQPDQLLRVMAHLLEPGGEAFFTGALTAAQVDHIKEFKRESELVLLAENAGFRVKETLSVAPERTLPRAKYLPRSMALLLKKRTSTDW